MKNKILEVALNKFLNKGYEGTSLSEIANEVGITKAALYYHFKNKDDMYLGVLDKYFESISEFNKDHHIEGESFKQFIYRTCKILENLTISLNEMNKDIGIGDYILIMDGIKRFESIREMLKRDYAKSVEIMEAKIAKAKEDNEISKNVNVADAACQLIYMLEGAKLMSSMKVGILEKEFAEDLFRQIWNIFE